MGSTTTEPASQPMEIVGTPWTLEDFAKTSQAFVTPLIAFIVAFVTGIIAYRQWRTAKDKLKLDLYDRRFSLYARHIKHFGDCVGDVNVDPDDPSYHSDMLPLSLLFGPEVNDHFMKTVELLRGWKTIISEVPSLAPSEFDDHQRKADAHIEVMRNHVRGTERVVRQYLSFSHLDRPGPNTSALMLRYLATAAKITGSAVIGVPRIEIEFVATKRK